MPAVGSALAADGSFTGGAFEIPEVGPALVIQGLFAGDPVVVPDLIACMQVNGFGFAPWAVVNHPGRAAVAIHDGLAALITFMLHVRWFHCSSLFLQ